MTQKLIILLATALLSVNSQRNDSQAPLAPPTGVVSDDSPALVANDPALVSAIVQGVINEVGAVTRQSEEPVHVTPQLVQDIVQKVLLKLSVTLTQLEPGFPAAPVNSSRTPSGPVNGPAAGPGRVNADTANPENKTESTGPHLPPVLTDAFGNLIHRLHLHHNDDDNNNTGAINADTANPANKTESRGMHLPHLHDIAESLGNLFHRNNNNSEGSADNTNADSADPANKTESGGLHLPARLHNLADNVRNFFHRHHDNDNDTDSTQADTADPANRTESDGFHLHNITHALDDLFHHHRHHHHHHNDNDTSSDADDDDNKNTNTTSSEKDINRNSAASTGENFPLQPPNPRRLGDNSNNISNAASVPGKDTASNDSATITVDPRRGYTYPTLHLGGVENKARSKEQICQQPPVTGLCRGYLPRFHYNATAGACTQFIYGGCGGNQNNFRTEQECTSFCAP